MLSVLIDDINQGRHCNFLRTGDFTRQVSAHCGDNSDNELFLSVVGERSSENRVLLFGKRLDIFYSERMSRSFLNPITIGMGFRPVNGMNGLEWQIGRILDALRGGVSFAS